MRQIGTLATEQSADRFVDYLTTLDISAMTEEDDEQYSIWIRDESKVAQARDEFARYQSEPDAATYENVRQAAEAIRQERLEKQVQARKNIVPMRGHWNRPMTRKAPLTMMMIGACVLAAIFSGEFGTSDGGPTDVDSWLMFANPARINYRAPTENVFVSIQEGELWRLATPIFLHGGMLHLLFNMLWLYQLGGHIEPKLGSGRMTSLVVAIAVLSNVLQAVMQGALFVGMSGVVYGLLGFIWTKMQREPDSGFFIAPQTMMFMMIWLVVCFSPTLSGVVANWAHFGGLAAGSALATLPIWSRPSAGT